MKYIRFMFLFYLFVMNNFLSASTLDEAMALKSWIGVPFSAESLIAERDAIISKLQFPVKGEYETTQQFEKRKVAYYNQINEIKKDYEQKIKDAEALYTAHQQKLKEKLQSLIIQSREVVVMEGKLGAYNADKQTYLIQTGFRNFEIFVPIYQAEDVKKNFDKYQLRVTRQWDENFNWIYLEAELSGAYGNFYSIERVSSEQKPKILASFTPPDLEASIFFNEPSGNQMLDAEETAQIVISIKNNGAGSAYMVEAKLDLQPSIGLSYPGNIYFGEIKPGETCEKQIKIIAGMGVPTGKVTLYIKFNEQNGFPPNDINLKFETKALQPPDIYVFDVGIDDFNKNGMIEPGESVNITVRIHNKGIGIAKNVIAEIKFGEGIIFYGGSNTFNLGNMSPGEYKDIVFDIYTAKTATKLDIKIDLKESRSQFCKMDQPLNLAFNQRQRTADQMVIAGKENKENISIAPSLSIDIEQDIPLYSKINNNRWGVILGIENYKNVSQVPYARRDAEFMREYFQKVLGIPSENIYIKTDDGASLSEFNAIFNPKGWLDKNANKNECEIFIFYSGHGVPDMTANEAYLLPYDGNPNFPNNTGYSLQQLYSNLSSLKAKKVTIFLDSCFSGANRNNEIILASAKPVFISPEMPAVAPNLSVFSAAQASQIASAYNEKQHGLFSYFLMKGLKGEANKDQDKKITEAELLQYLQENVGAMARRMGREQDPQLQTNDPQRILVQW